MEKRPTCRTGFRLNVFELVQQLTVAILSDAKEIFHVIDGDGSLKSVTVYLRTYYTQS